MYKLYTLLGIESGEESKVSLLLTQSVFLGIFIGAFDITSHSLLLSTFDEKMMARGYIFSGITGVLVSYINSHLKRIQFKNLAIVNLIVIAASTLLLWSVMVFLHGKWLIFLMFVFLGPLNIMALWSFWGTAARIVNRKRSRELLLITETGLILGIMLISFAIPFILFFKFHTHNILFLSGISIIVAIIIQRSLQKEFTAFQEENSPDTENTKSFAVVMTGDHYIRNMTVFSALSVVVAFFIQYLFMTATRVQYPSANEMAGFLGFYTGGVMIAILLLKMVFLPYALHNFNLRTCLIISPVVITIFSAIVAVVGLSMGYTPKSGTGFIIFFLFLAFNRVISKSLNESIESSAFRVFFESVDNAIKSRVKSAFAGNLHEISVIISGLILTCLGLLSFIELIHFSLFLLVISLIWIYVAFRLNKEYRISIINAIEKGGRPGCDDDFSNKQRSFKSRFSARIAFRQDYFKLISGDYSLLNNVENKWYFENIINWAYSKNDINLLPVLKKTSVDSRLDEGIRQHSADIAEIFQKNSSFINPGSEKNREALIILSGTRMPQTTEILGLLRESSTESKRLAIFMIGKFKLSDMLSEVCECLNIPGVAIDAFEVLRSFGSGIEEELMKFYLIKSGNIRLSKIILRLLGEPCKKETMSFLFSRLWSNSRQLKEEIVKYLIKCKFKPSEEEKKQLNLLASEVIGLITWNLSAKISLKRDNDRFLHRILVSETDRWNSFLFDVLSINYGADTLAGIREYLEVSTTESVKHALEIVDVLITEPLKSQLISLLSLVPEEMKIKYLSHFFPGEIPERKNLPEEIINRDYNQICLWSKACTLRNITSIGSDDMAESVTALLFSPEEIIQEEAANLIARSKPELYNSASQRLPDSRKRKLDKIISGITDNNELLFTKVEFLSKYFTEIPEDDLLPLASEMKYVKNLKGLATGFTDGCIVWSLSGKAEGIAIHILSNGEVDKMVTRYPDIQDISFYILPLLVVEEYHFQFPEKSFGILEFIEKNEE